MRTLNQLIGVRIPKNIDQIIAESIKLRDPFQHFATVIISQGDIIKSISQSKPNNLILDQFGTWLAALLRTPAGATKAFQIDDEGGTTRDMMSYGTWASNTRHFNASNVATGTDLKMGSGSTAATRADNDIETDLVTAPESGFFGSGHGSYAGGVVSVGAAITSGGTGTIREVGLFGEWSDDNVGVYHFMLLRDILAAPQAYTPGQTLTVAYSIQL